MLSKEIKVGLLALVALVALFVGFNYLRGSNILSSSHTYFAKYVNVDGLNAGAPVIFNGIKVGQVKSLALLPEEGNKVKVTLMFRGRQIAHPELGKQVVDRVAAELTDLAKIESSPTMEGKSMTMILAPK